LRAYDGWKIDDGEANLLVFFQNYAGHCLAWSIGASIAHTPPDPTLCNFLLHHGGGGHCAMKHGVCTGERSPAAELEKVGNITREVRATSVTGGASSREIISAGPVLFLHFSSTDRHQEDVPLLAPYPGFRLNYTCSAPPGFLLIREVGTKATAMLVLWIMLVAYGISGAYSRIFYGARMGHLSVAPPRDSGPQKRLLGPQKCSLWTP
jgi:hypothetical protein